MELAECPTSVAWRNPELISIMHIAAQAEGISEAFGHPMGSPSDWPGRLYDAVSIIKRQDRAVEIARMDADK